MPLVPSNMLKLEGIGYTKLQEISDSGLIFHLLWFDLRTYTLGTYTDKNVFQNLLAWFYNTPFLIVLPSLTCWCLFHTNEKKLYETAVCAYVCVKNLSNFACL